MANAYAFEKLSIRAELEATRCAVTTEVRALSTAVRAYREEWQRTTKVLQWSAAGWRIGR